MTNEEILLLLQAERIASELWGRSLSEQRTDPIFELVERWHEISAEVEDHPDDAASWDALLHVAKGLDAMTEDE